MNGSLGLAAPGEGLMFFLTVFWVLLITAVFALVDFVFSCYFVHLFL